jgi:hypothetical protein
VHAVFRTIGGRVTWRSLDRDLAEFLRAHPESDRQNAGEISAASEVARST